MGVFMFSVPLDIGKLMYYISVSDTGILCRAMLPFGVDIDNPYLFITLNCFLNYANDGARNGNFEISFDNGEIVYKTFIDCSGELIPPDEVFRNLIFCPAAMCHHYAPGILSIIFEGADIKSAVSKCKINSDEGDSDNPEQSEK